MPTPCQQATYTIHDSDVTSVCSTQPGYQRTSNVFPIRSPLLVADWLIPKVAGKTYVEIGTRDGDIFDCVSPHAKHAIAIEMDQDYCKSIRAKGQTVVCSQLNASSARHILPTADVYFWWIYNKYNLPITRWIDTELRRRGQRGTVYFPLTAELFTEQDALVKQADYLSKFHSGGLDQRLFFQEKAAPSYFRAPKGHCSANGPGASWGIFSVLRGEVGVQAKRRGGGGGGGGGRGESGPVAPVPYVTPPALRTAASDRAAAQLTACGRPAYEIADARCLSTPSLVLRSAYPQRSPLAVADFLADEAASANVRSAGVLSAAAMDEESDLIACLSSPLQPGGQFAPSKSRDPCGSLLESGSWRALL